MTSLQLVYLQLVYQLVSPDQLMLPQLNFHLQLSCCLPRGSSWPDPFSNHFCWELDQCSLSSHQLDQLDQLDQLAALPSGLQATLNSC